MPTIGIYVNSNAKIVKKGLQDLAAEIPRVGRLQIYRVMLRARSRLRKPGKAVKRPVPWDSVRQRVKVMIILRYVLKEMPYRRRGNLQKAFVIRNLKNGYELENQLERAGYIYGDAEGKGQTRLFRGRYPIMRKVLDEEFDKLPTAVVAHLELVARQKGLQSEG